MFPSTAVPRFHAGSSVGAMLRLASLRPRSDHMADLNFQNVIYEKRGRIGIVTINRPERMNAIDPQTSQEMHTAWCDFRDDDDLWVGIFTGAGDRAFSAGNDLVAMSAAQ